MGSEVSSCCGGGGGEAETQLHIPSPPEEGQVKYGETASEFTKEEKEAFMQRFYEGVDVHLILQDKSKLTCQVRLDRQHQFLLLSCDKKVRAIGLKDIKAVLHTKEQLKRVESSAGITDIETDKALFVECVNGAKAEVKEE